MTNIITDVVGIPKIYNLCCNFGYFWSYDQKYWVIIVRTDDPTYSGDRSVPYCLIRHNTEQYGAVKYNTLQFVPFYADNTYYRNNTVHTKQYKTIRGSQMRRIIFVFFSSRSLAYRKRVCNGKTRKTRNNTGFVLYLTAPIVL